MWKGTVNHIHTKLIPGHMVTIKRTSQGIIIVFSFETLRGRQPYCFDFMATQKNEKVTSRIMSLTVMRQVSTD